MRLMGLDVGSRTVGVAVSDLLGWTAQGVEIVRINEDEKQFGLDRIAELVQQYAVDGFVLGLPKNMDNSIGERAVKSQEYGQMLTDRFHLPVDFIDERLTTVQAQRMLIEKADTSRKKRKKVIDKLAAVMILQNYLDAKEKLTKLS
ncbi:Holliday junction resolvase RuvX [Lactobacillus selangorensis]